MDNIFISYSRKDTNFVDSLRARLGEENYRVWIDRGGIPGGKEWKGEIVTAIEECGVFLFVLSSSSVRSKHVKRELAIATKRGKTVIALEIKRTDIPKTMEYDLAGIQRIDFVTDAAQAMAKLLNDLPGAELRARKAAIQHDEDFGKEDEQFLLHLLDLEELDKKSEKLLDKLVKLDRPASIRAKDDERDSLQREIDEILKELDEISKTKKVKGKTAKRNDLYSDHLIDLTWQSDD